MNKGALLTVLGVLLLLAGLGVSLMFWASGAQPWGQLLGDNFWFARITPFTAGLGVAVGFWKAAATRDGVERRGDGAIRRFARSTIWLHALAGIAVVVLIATGGWQYIKGLIAADSPIYMGTVYRIHYIAASLLIFTTFAFLTDWLMRGDRGLTVSKGQMTRTLRALAHELPRPLGSTLGYGLGLDMRRAAPPNEKFTPYEKVVSFPLWELSIGLIVLTGVIKAMRYIYPIPGDLLYWISAAHVGAGVLLAMKFLDHLRYLLAPSRWPLMATMWSGWIPEGYVKRFHAAWYQQIAAESPTTAPATEPTPPAPAPAIGSAGGPVS
jgi:cytochrome b subunit of formate dehydrogenase